MAVSSVYVRIPLHGSGWKYHRVVDSHCRMRVQRGANPDSGMPNLLSRFCLDCPCNAIHARHVEDAIQQRWIARVRECKLKAPPEVSSLVQRVHEAGGAGDVGIKVLIKNRRRMEDLLILEGLVVQVWLLEDPRRLFHPVRRNPLRYACAICISTLVRPVWRTATAPPLASRCVRSSRSVAVSVGLAAAFSSLTAAACSVRCLCGGVLIEVYHVFDLQVCIFICPEERGQRCQKEQAKEQTQL
mmetsp:Transcript_19085/g.44608  ORF Transcript_19085/g.44608 Transcript_19085/m.44608 type:complete len:243 (-) Transcript_19085:123-851(-)